MAVVEYKFVKVELSFWGSKPKQDYHEVIQQNAADGWRLVQIFAPPTSGYGSAAYFELILERPIE